MQGITRVAIFCSLTTILPAILLVVPLYLRHSLYANVVYTVAESDIMEIDDGISTIFCSEHTLKMNSSFHAFKVSKQPEIASHRKHLRLKKSMTLPDDTLEYWGFYLSKGATVALSVCSRFQGASILVVRGERSLRTCGMMEHNENKKKLKEDYLPVSKRQVEVKFQSNAEEIISRELDNGNKETKQSIPFNNALILNDENLPISLDNNIARSNNKGNPISDKENPSINKDSRKVIKPESSKLSNSEEQQLNSIRESAMNHIRKHSVRWNGTRTGVDKFRHMRKRLGKISAGMDTKNDTEKSEYDSRKSEEKYEPRKNNKELYSEREKSIRELETELNSDPEVIEDDTEGEGGSYRTRRNVNGIKQPQLLDRGVEHGGNAINYTNLNEESSISSFENGLLTCYDGQVLFAQEFEPSDLCTNISFLVNSKRMQTQHNVTESGYYYYIFYSDNDFVSNDMHAVFDIYKPIFKYENQTQACINKTECSFSLGFLSGDRVIVEVPTRDGIEDTEDDLTLLTSTCRPRMAIYTIFPIAVLLLVLGCAFL